MAQDPLTFTKEGNEVKLIVEKLRASRGQFNLGNMKAGKVKAPAAPKSASGKAAASLGLSLNLSSLLGKKE